MSTTGYSLRTWRLPRLLSALPEYSGPWASLAVAASLMLWFISLRLTDATIINDFGLTAALNPLYFVAFFVLVVSFCICIPRAEKMQSVLFFHVGALILMLHGTPAWLYETARYGWAFKHIGVVSFIQERGLIIPGFDIYHDWPAFFSFFAFFNEIAGIESALQYALFAQVLFGFLFLSAMLLVLRALTSDPRVIWLGAWFFVLTNWVAQDYFAPQAMAYYFFLIVIGVTLLWFGTQHRLSNLPLIKLPYIKRFAPLWQRLTEPFVINHDGTPATPLQRTAALGVLLLAAFSIVAGHQLTPMMLLGVSLALILVGAHRLRALPLLLVLMTLLWMTHAGFASLTNRTDWYGSAGTLTSNVEGSLTDLSETSRARTIVSASARFLSLAIWVLGGLGFLRRLWNRHLDLAPLAMIGGVIPVVIMQAYGGEILFRAFLFTLPGFVYFAATLFFPVPPNPTSANTNNRPVIAGLLVACFALVSLMVVAYYGNERMNRFTSDEVAAVQFVYDTAPEGALLLTVNSNIPSQFTSDYYSLLYASILDRYTWILDYEEFIYQELGPQHLPIIAEAMALEYYPEAYLLITRSQAEHVALHGTLRGDSIATLIALLSSSDEFQLVFQNPDAHVFKYIAQEVPIE